MRAGVNACSSASTAANLVVIGGLVTTTAPPATGDYAIVARSFRRSLLAENLAPNSIRLYMEAVDVFGAFLAAQGMPTRVAHITREHVETFIADQLARWRPNTASSR